MQKKPKSCSTLAYANPMASSWELVGKLFLQFSDFLQLRKSRMSVFSFLEVC